MNIDARLEAVEMENERLRDRVSELEGAMGMRFLTPVEWRLTGSEGRVFGVLMEREVATKQTIMSALYRTDGIRDEAEIKIVDVYICKARKKLLPFGIKIETRWGEGYFLTAATKDHVRHLMNPALAA